MQNQSFLIVETKSIADEWNFWNPELCHGIVYWYLTQAKYLY